MRWSVWGSLVAAVLLTGCSSPVQGTASSDPGYVSPTAGSGAAELLGPPGTLDACSLLDPASLAQFGVAQVPPQEGPGRRSKVGA